jgi:hypothetical protein
VATGLATSTGYGKTTITATVNGVSTTATLKIDRGTPIISWPTPASITYGTSLSAAQLNASSSVAGSFAYSPAIGTVLGVGLRQLKVTFTPTDQSDYAVATASVKLMVKQAALAITAKPQSKTYGTALTLGTTAFTTSGLLNSDTVTGVTLTSTGGAATAGVSGSPYQIVPSAAVGTGLANYTISYVDGKLTVTAATLKVAAANKTKKQGTPNPTLTYTMSGFVNGDTQATVTTGQPKLTTTATTSSPKGPYPITITAGTGTGALQLKTTNYKFAFVKGTLTVD